MADSIAREPTVQSTDKLLLDKQETLKRINNQPFEGAEREEGNRMSHNQSPCSPVMDTFVHFSPHGTENSFSASTPVNKFPENGAPNQTADRFQIRNMSDDDDDSSGDSEDEETGNEVPRTQLLHEHAYSTQPRIPVIDSDDAKPLTINPTTRMVSLLDNTRIKIQTIQGTEVQLKDNDPDHCNQDSGANSNISGKSSPAELMDDDQTESVETPENGDEDEVEEDGDIEDQEDDQEMEEQECVVKDTKKSSGIEKLKVEGFQSITPLNAQESEKADFPSGSNDNESEGGSETETYEEDGTESKVGTLTEDVGDPVSENEEPVTGVSEDHKVSNSDKQKEHETEPKSEFQGEDKPNEVHASHEMECQTEAMFDDSSDNEDDGQLVIEDEAGSERSKLDGHSKDDESSETLRDQNKNKSEDLADDEIDIDDQDDKTDANIGRKDVNDTTMEIDDDLEESNMGNESNVGDDEKEDMTLSMLCESVAESDLFPKSDDEEDEEEEEEKKAPAPKRRRLNSGASGNGTEWREEYGSTRDLDGDPELFKIPFEEGWKREIVIRGVFEEYTKSGQKRAQKPADVYYFTPDGTKLRSKIQISNYLRDRGSEMTELNFTFIRKPIHKPPSEKIRMAGRNRSRAGGRRSLNAEELLASSVSSPSKRGRRKKKGRSPGRPRKHPLPATATKGKAFEEIMVQPPADLMPPPQVVMEREGEEEPYDQSSSSVGISPATPLIRPRKSKPTARKSTTQAAKMYNRPMSFPGSSPSSSRNNHIQLVTKVDQLCGLDCPGRNGEHPSVQCGICMCLFHPECVNVIGNTRPVLFVCLRCQRGGGKRADGSSSALQYKPSATSLVLNKSNWSPKALKTVTTTSTLPHNITIRMGQPGIGGQTHSALRTCLETQPSMSTMSAAVAKAVTAASSTFPQGSNMRTIYIPMSSKDFSYTPAIGPGGKVTLVAAVPQFNNLGQIPSVMVGADPNANVTNVPVGLVPNTSVSNVVIPNVASVVPTTDGASPVLGGMQGLPMKIVQHPIQQGVSPLLTKVSSQPSTVNSLPISVMNSSTNGVAASASVVTSRPTSVTIPSTTTAAALVSIAGSLSTSVTNPLTTASTMLANIASSLPTSVTNSSTSATTSPKFVISQPASAGITPVSVLANSQPTVLAPVWNPPTGTYIDPHTDTTKGTDTSTATGTIMSSASLPTTPSPASSTGSASVPAAGPALPPKLTPAPARKAPSCSQGATPPQPPQLLKNGITVVNNNPQSGLTTPVPSLSSSSVTVPVSELISSVSAPTVPVEGSKDHPQPQLLHQGQSSGKLKESAHTPAQILTLPPAVLQRLNLKEPLALKINNTHILVPPSCFLKTYDGVKVCLPANTLKMLSAGQTNNYMEMQVKFVGQVPEVSATIDGQQISNSAGKTEVSKDINISESSDTSSSKVQKPSADGLNIRPTKRPGINPGLCYFQKLFGGLEAMLEVFKYLNTKDLLRASRVCKTWNRIASQRSLWQHVDFSRLKMIEWRKAMQFLRQVKVESLNLEGYCHSAKDGDSEVNMIELLPFLADLPFLRKLYLGEIPVRVLHQVAGHLTHLTEFTTSIMANTEPSERLNLDRVCRMTRLRVLKLSRSRSTAICEEVVQACGTSSLPVLKQLEVLSLGAVTGIEDQDTSFLGEMTKLRSLELTDCSTWSSSSFFMLGQLTDLEELKISGGGEIPDIGLADALINAKKLRHLELIHWIVADSLQPALSQMESLETLVIQPNTSSQAAVVNANTLAAVIKLPNLQRLDWGIVHSQDSTIILHDEQGNREVNKDEDSAIQKTQCIPFLSESTHTENLTSQEIDQMTQFVSVEQLREKLRKILTCCEIHVHMCSSRVTESINVCSAEAEDSVITCSSEDQECVSVCFSEGSESIMLCSSEVNESVNMCSNKVRESANMCSSEVNESATMCSSELSESATMCSSEVSESATMCSSEVSESVVMSSPVVSDSISSPYAEPSDMEIEDSQNASNLDS